MKSKLFSFKILLIALLALSSGCSNAPISTIRYAYLPTCEAISVSQGGKEIMPRNGVLYVERQPFSIRYQGNEPEPEPAVIISENDRLNTYLTLRNRKEMWAGTGQFMAHSPNDLFVNDEAHFYTDEPSRDEFAALIGDGYKPLLRTMVAENSLLDTATYIPKIGGFIKASDGRGYLYPVDTINSVPLADTPFNQLHMSYFAMVERYGANKTGWNRQYLSLIKMKWGACVISFEK